MFACCVAGTTNQRGKSGDTTDYSDDTTIGDKLWQSCMRQIERPEEIYLHDTPNDFRIGVLQQAAVSNSGVVDNAIQCTEMRDGIINGATAESGVSDISGQR